MKAITNLFKVAPVKTEQEIIQEIHDSFDNAQEELLSQAMAIINNHSLSDTSKADRLEALGFTRSKTVVKNIENKKVLVESKKDADLVNYYKQTYPFLKFLKEEQLDTICEKYGLMYAPVDRYTKDVPDKNVSEIESAQGLKWGDEARNKDTYTFLNSYNHRKSDFKKVIQFLGSETLNEEKMDSIYKSLGISKGFRSYSDFIYDITDQLPNVLGVRKSLLTNCIHTKVDVSGLFIAAPKSHFDLTGLKQNGKGFFKTTVKEVKDPIVFRYVKGGIQVLSKWGLEADDEMLQVDILN